MQTFAEVIKRLGQEQLAERLGCPVATVTSWQYRNTIPAHHWPRVVDLAVQQGEPDITVEALLSILEAKRVPAPSPESPSQEAAE